MNENLIGIRIHTKRKELGLTLDELAKKSGIPRSSIAGFEHGITNSMKHTNVKALADALGVKPTWLLGWDDQPAAEELEPVPETKRIPIIGEIAAGTPITAQENWAGEANCPTSVQADFCLRVKGNSMINARIFDGDLVFIKQQPDVDNGEIAAVLIDDSATLKRVYKYKNRVELRAENPIFEPMNFEGSDLQRIRIIGKAIAFLSKVR